MLNACHTCSWEICRSPRDVEFENSWFLCSPITSILFKLDPIENLPVSFNVMMAVPMMVVVMMVVQILKDCWGQDLGRRKGATKLGQKYWDLRPIIEIYDQMKSELAIIQFSRCCASVVLLTVGIISCFRSLRNEESAENEPSLPFGILGYFNMTFRPPLWDKDLDLDVVSGSNYQQWTTPQTRENVITVSKSMMVIWGSAPLIITARLGSLISKYIAAINSNQWHSINEWCPTKIGYLRLSTHYNEKHHPLYCHHNHHQTGR